MRKPNRLSLAQGTAIDLTPAGRRAIAVPPERSQREEDRLSEAFMAALDEVTRCMTEQGFSKSEAAEMILGYGIAALWKGQAQATLEEEVQPLVSAMIAGIYQPSASD